MTNDFQLIDGVLRLKEGTRYVRSQQFAGNEEIEELIVPQGVGFIEDEAFAECENLRRVSLPDGLSSIGVAAFASCGSLESINLPAGLKSIGDGAFLFCISLRELSFPEGLEEIQELAFQNTGLETVRLPASLRYIGEEAFFDCEQLQHADVLGKDTRICKNAFGSNYNLLSGYIAPGFPEEQSSSAELLYSLLYCSCPDRHSSETAQRAESFIRRNEALVMERVLKMNNIPAASGLVKRSLISAALADECLKAALAAGQTEISALLLQLKSSVHSDEGEFEL